MCRVANKKSLSKFFFVVSKTLVACQFLRGKARAHGTLNSKPNSPLAESEQHALRLFGPDVGVWNNTRFILENVRSRDWFVSIRQLFWSAFCLLQNQSSSQQVRHPCFLVVRLHNTF